ncbi:MAG: DUF4136 domain-containing protein [Bacteroidales bacterium]|nr:DUF4136 domain-containing protein [Bacteroidales bacterium]
MKRTILLLGVFICLFSGCTTLMPTSVTLKSPINEYQYVYITPTSEKNSVEGVTLGGSYGIYGATTTHSVNPTDVISGHFIQRGFIRVPEVKPENADKTLVVNYGEVKSGYYIDLYHGISIVIQMISASDNEIICVCNAEGKGDSDAEAVHNAIDRCLDEFFRQINQ